MKNDMLLVGGLEHGFYLSINILGIIIPTDELTFFRGVGQPPIRNGLPKMTMFVRPCPNFDKYSL